MNFFYKDPFFTFGVILNTDNQTDNECTQKPGDIEGTN